MLVRYGYQVKNIKFIGFYECEDEDFKKMWKEIKCDVLYCMVMRNKVNGKWMEVYEYEKNKGWGKIK